MRKDERVVQARVAPPLVFCSGLVRLIGDNLMAKSLKESSYCEK